MHEQNNDETQQLTPTAEELADLTVAIRELQKRLREISDVLLEELPPEGSA